MVGVADVVGEETARLLRGDVLDMWRAYIAASPDVRSELGFYDVLSAREGMLFPDFFTAVHHFLRGVPLVSRSGLEAELGGMFSAMHDEWDSYGPFFSRHPELRYFNRLNAFSFARPELADKLPSFRSLAAPLFWSLGEYYRAGSSLATYVRLDGELLRQPAVGTLFQRDGSDTQGDFRITLKPYGSLSAEIAPYLRLLKHGDFVGFGSVALASIEGMTLLAVTSLQTDLLRVDRVVGRREELGPVTFFPDIKVNRNREFTVPRPLRTAYLDDYAWVHKILEAVESAAASLSAFGVEGIVVPTTSFKSSLGQHVVVSGAYAKGAYDVVAGERGYLKGSFNARFTLTGQRGKGPCWVRPAVI